MQSWWKVTAMRFRGIVQATAFLVLAGGVLAADRFPPDPVQDLRDALKVPVRDPMKNQAELDFRMKNVGKRIDALKTLGDLRRALPLQEWRDEDREEAIAKVDRDLRARVVDRFVKGIQAVMEKGSPASQQAAADMLGEMGTSVRGAMAKTSVPQELTPELVKLTKSKTPEVRMAAGRTLGKIHADPKLAVPALGDMLISDQPALRKAAAEGLVFMVESALNTHKGRGATTVEINRGDLITTGSLVVPVAAKGINDAEAEIRKLCCEAIHYAATALGELVFDSRPRLDFPPLERKPTDDERTEIEDYAKQVEGERRDLAPLTKALLDQAATLSRAMSDPNAAVRLRATKAMEEAGNARLRLVRRASSVPPFDKKIPQNEDHLYTLIRRNLRVLLDRLHDRETPIRLAVLNVFETLEQDAVIVLPYLVEALQDPNRFVCWAAVRVLGKTAPAQAELVVPALADTLSVPDIDVRVTTADVLERYGAAAQAALPALMRDVTRGDAEMRIGAIQAIQAMGPAGKAAVPTLILALNDNDPEVRKTAAEALGRLGPDAISALDALRQKLDEDNADVSKAASDAILSIQP